MSPNIDFCILIVQVFGGHISKYMLKFNLFCWLTPLLSPLTNYFLTEGIVLDDGWVHLKICYIILGVKVELQYYIAIFLLRPQYTIYSDYCNYSSYVIRITCFYNYDENRSPKPHTESAWFPWRSDSGRLFYR